MPTLGWRWLLILSAVPLMLFAILCFVRILSGIRVSGNGCTLAFCTEMTFLAWELESLRLWDAPQPHVLKKGWITT